MQAINDKDWGTPARTADQSVTLDPTRTFVVATLDFLAEGGDGFDGLEQDHPLDLGIVREKMADDLAVSPTHFTTALDGRWTLVPPAH